MDKLDIGVLRELLVDETTLTISADVRRPYLAIARELHVTEDTVRNRILRMRRAGLITGWTLGINPTLLGYQTAFVWADVNPPATKEDVIRTMRKNPHVLMIQNYFGNSVGIGLTYASGEGLDHEVTRIRRISNSRSCRASETPPLPCDLKLTEMDWLIAKSLRRNPRKSYRKVADEFGLSRRTIERRTQRMINAGALFVLPELDLRKLEGGDLASLNVYYQSEFKQDVDKQIGERYGEFLLISHSTSLERGWYVFVVPNVTFAHEIQSWASELQGVRTTDLRLIEEYINLVGRAFEKELQITPPIPAVARRTHLA